MHVLVISNYYPPLELGGWEQLTQDVVERLQNRGHQVFVLTSNHHAAQIKKPEPNVVRILHLASPDHNHYHPHYTLISRWREYGNRKSLLRTMRQFAPDVIFINGMWNLSPDLAWYAEQLLPGRVVYYIASPWPTDPSPDEIYWRSPAARPWLRGPKAALGAFVRYVLRNDSRQRLRFDRVLCVSEFMRRYMIEEVGVPAENTCVVHNGIDVSRFPMRDLDGAGNGPLQLLYAGGLLEHKGVHTAIEALGVLVHRLGVRQAHLTLVGDGHPAYVGRLRDLAHDLAVSSYITFHGRVPRTEMPDLLRRFDVLLFPSLWSEPLARIVQETMACGLVVIGTTTGGTPEILQHGENGLTFEVGNAEMLAERIARLVGDSETRIRYALNARRTVEQGFTLERMVDEVETHLLTHCRRGSNDR